MSPRKYDTSHRREATEATRGQILEAARQLLGVPGDLRDFSVDAIATKAGVARMTVYYQFHSRAQLLDALSDHLAERGGMHRMPEVFMESDPRRALDRLVTTFVAFWSSDRVAMRRLRALGVVAPGLWGRSRARDAWRREAVTHLLAKFDRGTRGGSRSAREAEVDLITVLASFETFDALCTGERSVEDIARLLVDAALTLLGRNSR
ncbi:MAG: TetR/AcrR family transcriptional regulator [Thermoplasmata archaeon]